MFATLAVLTLILACTACSSSSAGEVCDRNLSTVDLQLRDSMKLVTEMELQAAEEESSAVMQVQLLQKSQMKKRGEKVSPSFENARPNHGSGSSQRPPSAMQTAANRDSDTLAVELEEKPWGEAEKVGSETPAAVAGSKQSGEEKAQPPSFLQVSLAESPSSKVDAAAYSVTARETEGPTTQLIHGAIMLVFLFFMVYLLKVFTRVPQDWLGMKAGPSAGQAAPPVEKKGAVRTYVEEFNISPATDVGDLLPVASSYDCIFQKPVMSGKALRLEARIEGLSDGGTLLAPLTQRSCVLYSAEARCNKGPTPVKSSKAPNFVVSLIGAPLMQIEVEGQDVSLFDIVGGKWTCSQPLLEAAPHLQDFVVTNTGNGMDPENECETSSSLRALGPGVEFEECALLVGSTVTIVGELYRAPSGSLSLRPWRESALDELTDTIKPTPASWENHGIKATPKAIGDEVVVMSSDEIVPGKLLLSDSPDLLGSVVHSNPKTEEIPCKDENIAKSWEVKLAGLNGFFERLEWMVKSSKQSGGDSAKDDVWEAMWGNEDSCAYLAV